MDRQTEIHNLHINGQNSNISIFTTMIHNDFFAGIYTTNSPEAVRYVVEHSRANFVVVEDQEQLDKVY